MGKIGVLGCWGDGVLGCWGDQMIPMPQHPNTPSPHAFSSCPRYHRLVLARFFLLLLFATGLFLFVANDLDIFGDLFLALLRVENPDFLALFYRRHGKTFRS